MQLVINTFGAALRKEGDRFLVTAAGKKLAVSAHKVQSILITTAAYLSTDAVELAAAHNIDLVFLTKHGDPFARVWQSRMGSTAAIRRRQIDVADSPEGLGFARDWVSAKLRHQLEFLEELWHRRPEAAALFQGPVGTLNDCLGQVNAMKGTLDAQRGTLMGLEGGAGRAYFRCLGQLVPEAFRFESRSRQPAADAFNAMLNYSYGPFLSANSTNAWTRPSATRFRESPARPATSNSATCSGTRPTPWPTRSWANAICRLSSKRASSGGTRPPSRHLTLTMIRRLRMNPSRHLD